MPEVLLDSTFHVPFNLPFSTGLEESYIQEAITHGQLSGDGYFSNLCQQWLIENIGCKAAFLTPSGTSALEMASVLSNVAPGDEVILPSFTFVSTASSFVLRGAVPVFVDIREDTLNIDENKLEQAITKKTKAILPVHYGGIACNMPHIIELAKANNLIVIEDAAHAIMSESNNQKLGSFGQMSALSFHETKNISCGEGGALLINDESLIERAYMVWNKGTDRKSFQDGLVDKYTWQVLGSSFLLSELNAAVLYSQLRQSELICAKRRFIWHTYHKGLENLELTGHLRRPTVPADTRLNGHLYYILLNSQEQRNKLISFLKARRVDAVFHYVPLHSSPAGQRFGRPSGSLDITDSVSGRLLRLPLFFGLSEEMQKHVLSSIEAFFKYQ